MKRFLAFVLVGMLFPAFAETGKSPAGQVERKMTVPRCRAVLENGSQCPNQACKGKAHCWRHRGLAKDATDSWKATKTWSTNALEKTRRATEKATRSTQEAFEKAGEELTKLVRENFKKDTTQKGFEK